MIAEDEASVVCDFAETYHVLEYRELPARRAALLACGLGDGSRIKRKLLGIKVPMETLLLAKIVDAAQLLVWQNTRDGQEGRNQPASIAAALLEADRPKERTGFATAAEFDAWRAAMLNGGD